MSELERLKLCEVCSNRKFDPNSGLICGLTMLKPAFEGHCEDYNNDPFETANRQRYVAEFGEQLQGVHPVSASTRFANYVIDQIVMVVLSSAIFIGMDFANIGSEIIESTSRLGDYIFGAILSLIYYTSIEAATGRSIGKLITKTVVVKTDGRKPEFQDIIARSFSRIVPFDALSFLGSGVGWHDKWSNTRVVKKDSLAENDTTNDEILDRSI